MLIGDYAIRDLIHCQFRDRRRKGSYNFVGQKEHAGCTISLQIL